jgi:hypothetical protein
MQTLERIKHHKRPVGPSDAGGRLQWLGIFCRLQPMELEVLRVVAGVQAPAPPDPDGWPVRALAEHLGLLERMVVDYLSPGAPLVHWGLVRVTAGDPRIALNERIERFLFSS